MPDPAIYDKHRGFGGFRGFCRIVFPVYLCVNSQSTTQWLVCYTDHWGSSHFGSGTANALVTPETFAKAAEPLAMESRANPQHVRESSIEDGLS